MILPSTDEALARIINYADSRTTQTSGSTGDALLSHLRADTDAIERLQDRRRLLVAYARHLARPGPYTWSTLAAATHLSVTRVRDVYTDEDLAALVGLLSPKDIPWPPD